MPGTKPNPQRYLLPASSGYPAASRRIKLLLPLLFALLHDPSAAIAKGRGTISSRLGVAVQKSAASCLYIHNAELADGSPLTLVLLSSPQSTMKAEVVKPAPESCSSIDTSDTDLKSYEIRLTGEGQLPAIPSIAITGFPGRFQTRSKEVTADINEDGQPEYFRYCASSDGIHLTVWSGKPLRGKRKWHQYYYLGYDVEPNCTPAETRTSGH
jgi:hypothetical protein